MTQDLRRGECTHNLPPTPFTLPFLALPCLLTLLAWLSRELPCFALPFLSLPLVSYLPCRVLSCITPLLSNTHHTGTPAHKVTSTHQHTPAHKVVSSPLSRLVFVCALSCLVLCLYLSCVVF